MDDNGSNNESDLVMSLMTKIGTQLGTETGVSIKSTTQIQTTKKFNMQKKEMKNTIYSVLKKQAWNAITLKHSSWQCQ